MKTYVVLFLSVFGLFSCQKNADLEFAYKTDVENVYILKDSFGVMDKSKKLVYRNMWLYLPPDYHISKKSYPVIYMHDGQNLFDAKYSYAGEWKVDETLNNLFEKTNKGFIVVGIENAGVERMNEYSPWVHEKYGGGNGDAYLKMIISDLKPKIDKALRTKPEAESTAIVGSSMGGLISYYGGLKHPNIFKKIGALSSSFWFSNEVEEFTTQYGDVQGVKLFLVVGGNEGGGMDTDMFRIKDMLLRTGFNSNLLKTKLNPDAEHNEKFWGDEFEGVITWLFDIK